MVSELVGSHVRFSLLIVAATRVADGGQAVELTSATC